MSQKIKPIKHYDPWCDPYKPKTIYCDDVVKAHRIVKESIPTTPLTKANACADFGLNLYFKRETVHKTGSFHERSAVYALHKLTKEQRKNGVFTASIGNWATALSYHAQKMNIPVTAYTPATCRENCIQYCRDYGATIVEAGKTMTEARGLAIEKMKESTGATDCYINGFDHPHVIAGAGTIALEILEQLPNVDAILVPIGGGGLIAGIAAVIKKLKPSTLIYGIEPYQDCCFYKALANERPYVIREGQRTIPIAGCNAFHTAQSLLDKVILVDENCIARSLLHFVEEERFIVEPRAATALAVLFADPNVVPELRDKNVVCVVTGGSIDASFPRTLERAKAVEGRTMTIKIALPVGRPDECVKAFQILCHLRCNIKYHTMEHNWLDAQDLGKYYVIMLCETRGVAHASSVKNVLEKLYPDLVEYYDHTYFEQTKCQCYPNFCPDWL